MLKCQEFLENQGIFVNLPVILQDNMSTITLATKGGGKHRNKHLRSRQAWVRERVKNKEVEIKYLNTKQMVADALTKPLQGELFRNTTRHMLGHSTQVHAFLDRGALSKQAGRTFQA